LKYPRSKLDQVHIPFVFCYHWFCSLTREIDCSNLFCFNVILRQPAGLLILICLCLFNGICIYCSIYWDYVTALHRLSCCAMSNGIVIHDVLQTSGEEVVMTIVSSLSWQTLWMTKHEWLNFMFISPCISNLC